MRRDLHALTGIRGWLTESLLAYLLWVERQEAEPPHYFPRRLRQRADVLNAIWRRLQVRSHPEKPTFLLGRRQPAAPWPEADA